MTAAESVSDALARAFERTPGGGVMVAAGSIFLVGDLMKMLGIQA
jgi:hypothetical protein